MWPKALSQLIELAPHISRLLPMADHFLKDKAAGEEATRQAVDGQRTALEAQRATLLDLSDRLHADIGSLASAQTTQAATLQRQVTELEKSVAAFRTEAAATRAGADQLQTRLERLEATQRRTQTLAMLAIALLLIVIALLAAVLLRAH